METKLLWWIKRAAILLLCGFFLNVARAQDGEQLFQQCKACHTIGQGKLLGPDLLDMTKRHDRTWLKNFIKSSQTMIKNGDPAAVAIFEEYNNLVMMDYNWPDADLEAVIDYIAGFSEEAASGESAGAAASMPEAPSIAEMDTDENAAKGKALFEGSRRFKNGGASCIACHHVDAAESVQGGLLAKDLTQSFSRIGGLAGLKGIIEFPPYPAMKDAYAKAPITEKESMLLQVFLMRADKMAGTTDASAFDLMKSGIIGVLILLATISLVWFRRKKRSVNYEIIKRQQR